MTSVISVWSSLRMLGTKYFFEHWILDSYRSIGLLSGQLGGAANYFPYHQVPGDCVNHNQCMLMETEATRQRGGPRKTWRDCVKDHMKSFGLYHKDSQDKDDWRVKVKGATD